LSSNTRRLAVLADVGADEGEIAGVARPHPVVDVAAVGADALRRRVDHAHVADFQVAEQAVGVAAGEAVELAAVTGFGFALGHQLLFQVLQRHGAAGGIRRGGDRGLRFGGDVADRIERVDARVRAGGNLVGEGGGVEAGFDQVVLGGRIELQAAVGAMVVGHHQALRRDEAGGAAAERDHRAHRLPGQVGQLFRRQFQAGLLQLRRHLRQLLRDPHALARRGAADATGERQREDLDRMTHAVLQTRKNAFEYSPGHGAEPGPGV